MVAQLISVAWEEVICHCPRQCGDHYNDGRFFNSVHKVLWKNAGLNWKSVSHLMLEPCCRGFTLCVEGMSTHQELEKTQRAQCDHFCFSSKMNVFVLFLHLCSCFVLLCFLSFSVCDNFTDENTQIGKLTLLPWFCCRNLNNISGAWGCFQHAAREFWKVGAIVESFVIDQWPAVPGDIDFNYFVK